MTDPSPPRPIRVAIVRYDDDSTDLGVIYREHDQRTNKPCLTVVWPNECNGGSTDADPVVKQSGRFTMDHTYGPNDRNIRLTTVRRLWQHPVPHGRSLEDDASQRVRWLKDREADERFWKNRARLP